MGKGQDRLQLMALFNTDMLSPILRAADSCKSSVDDPESHYFYKKIVEILVELGNQLCVIWADQAWKKEIPFPHHPPNLNVFLNALLAYSGHPSYAVNIQVNELWTKFYKHSEISKDEVFR